MQNRERQTGGSRNKMRRARSTTANYCTQQTYGNKISYFKRAETIETKVELLVPCLVFPRFNFLPIKCVLFRIILEATYLPVPETKRNAGGSVAINLPQKKQKTPTAPSSRLQPDPYPHLEIEVMPKSQTGVCPNISLLNKLYS